MFQGHLIDQILELMHPLIMIVFNISFTRVPLVTPLLLTHQLVFLKKLIIIVIILRNACSRAVRKVQGGHLVSALAMEVGNGARDLGATRVPRAGQLSAKLMEEAGDAKCLDAPRV